MPCSRPRLVAMSAAVLLGLAGCSEPAPESTAQPASKPAPEPAPEPASKPAATADRGPAPPSQQPTIERQIDEARADLAAAEGVQADRITVVSARAVNWSSGALGCPQPDMNYTMALVPGVQIVLDLNGARHSYHAGGDREPFRCPPERIEAPATGMGEELM